jgi:hypothetical protein
MPDTEYNLVERLPENEDLTGLTLSEAFCLGVEFQMVRARVMVGHGDYDEVVHTDNADRLVKMCLNNGRVARHERTDVEGWSTLHIGPHAMKK